MPSQVCSTWLRWWKSCIVQQFRVCVCVRQCTLLSNECDSRLKIYIGDEHKQVHANTHSKRTNRQRPYIGIYMQKGDLKLRHFLRCMDAMQSIRRSRCGSNERTNNHIWNAKAQNMWTDWSGAGGRACATGAHHCPCLFNKSWMFLWKLTRTYSQNSLAGHSTRRNWICSKQFEIRTHTHTATRTQCGIKRNLLIINQVEREGHQSLAWLNLIRNSFSQSKSQLVIELKYVSVSVWSPFDGFAFVRKIVCLWTWA